MQEFDLVIIGAGSGNMIPGPEHDDWKIAVIEKAKFGGTCLNHGCIPSKMLLQSAYVAETVKNAGTFGVKSEFKGIDWKALTGRVWDRIDPLSEMGEAYRGKQPNTTVFKGTARFTGRKQIEVNGEQITGRHIVISAGGRPRIPEIPGLADVTYYTSDEVMRLDEQPASIIILGGGYIGAEMGHFFGCIGTLVTVIDHGDKMIRVEDDDICVRFTEKFASQHRLLLNSEVISARPQNADGTGVTLEVDVAGERQEVSADALLIASGRIPNSDLLQVEQGGVEIDERGKVVTDDFLETRVEGVWAMGDITSPVELKHFANLEARTIKHNISNPGHKIKIDYRGRPYAVFASPQVASVGLTEREVHEQGIPHIVGRQDYAATAYGWATEDTDSFVKVIAHATNRRILGAHIIGPQASILIQPLINAYELGQTVDDLAHVIYIHPALTEVVEQALLKI